MAANGFWLFLIDVTNREKSKGRQFKHPNEAHGLASREWHGLSVEEKFRYKEKARVYKQSKEYYGQRLASKQKVLRRKIQSKEVRAADEWSSDEEPVSYEDFGNFFDSGNNPNRRDRDRRQLTDAMIENFGIDNLDKKITTESFFVMSVQNYFETTDHEYMPAEISIVEFSLLKGIINQYNVLLKPNHIPESFLNRLSQQIEETHKICIIPSPTECRGDYERVVDEMNKIYAKQKTPEFRVFVLSNQYNSVQGALKAIRQNVASNDFISADKVSNVDDLLIVLMKLKNLDVGNLDKLQEILLETKWDLEPNTLCKFHNGCQSKFCALGVAKKICYYIFEHLKVPFELNLTKDHLPELPFGVEYRSAFRVEKIYKIDPKELGDDDEQLATLVPTLNLSDGNEASESKNLPENVQMMVGAEGYSSKDALQNVEWLPRPIFSEKKGRFLYPDEVRYLMERSENAEKDSRGTGSSASSSDESVRRPQTKSFCLRLFEKQSTKSAPK